MMTRGDLLPKDRCRFLAFSAIRFGAQPVRPSGYLNFNYYSLSFPHSHLHNHLYCYFDNVMFPQLLRVLYVSF
jgi:hypothetical protein